VEKISSDSTSRCKKKESNDVARLILACRFCVGIANARIMKGKTSSRNKPGERLTWGHAREFLRFELLGLLEGSLETSVKGRVTFLLTDTVVDLYSCASSPPSSSLRTAYVENDLSDERSAENLMNLIYFLDTESIHRSI